MLYSRRGSMSSESSISCLTIDPTLTEEGLGGSQRWDESGTVGTGDSTVEEEAEVQNNNVVGLARTPPPPSARKVVSGERIKLHKSKMGRRATTASVMFGVGGGGDGIAKPSEMVKETQKNSGRGEGRGGGQTKVPNDVFLHPIARKQRRGSGGASIHSMTASARARVAERRKSML
ncbi:hypothetical protein TL16_g09391 [Triparma laevis f. inornata]|uniref:Uncharacterized protein n=1 Tax=Triparma laevis f. inornata TaxID=1714386 RepID=A0A9W7EM32_9STRA|nr:hypothetical protein TL16_g09391 [Triparma laevis f. inornata]